MALFASPFDIFVNDDPFLHRPHRRRRLLRHDHGFARHHFDPFFRFLAAVSDRDDDRMDVDGDERAAARDVVVFEPEVTETDLGYLLTARVPGVSAADVAVAVKSGARGGDVLTVRSTKHAHVKADLRLPKSARVNVADIAASCIDGVLRVAVPKVTPTSDAVVVAEPPKHLAAAAAAGEKEKNEDDDRARTIVLQVPGYSRDDITVTRKRPADELVVSGKSRRRGGGSFSRTYRLTDPDAAVTATCADGLLTIRIVNPVVAPFAVPVSAEKLLPSTGDVSGAADAADAQEKEKEKEEEKERRITLMRHAVPGASAGDFEIEAREGTLRARADCSVAGLGRRRFEFAVSLPAHLDRSTLSANVSDGLLTVTAAAPAAPAPVDVTVSGDRPAALPAAAAAAAAAEKTAAEPEGER